MSSHAKHSASVIGFDLLLPAILQKQRLALPSPPQDNHLVVRRMAEVAEMIRLLCGLILMSSAFVAFAAAAEPTDAELRKKPITTAPGQLGLLLRDWYARGTAAGNVGDWYDNRDGEHSPLDLSAYPQLRKVRYTPEDVKARRHWALQPRTLPHVVIGNSSTSGEPHLNGSNPRTYYCSPRGMEILQNHYRKNNLYIYPEHRDHDPGHNGLGNGYGDLYPTNTPYLIISQGSSISDLPFMRALPFTLAAFRPEVKKKLIQTGLLMPTVQMIFRSSNRHLAKAKEYLTGKAHPTVFEGSWVDQLKMVQLAHDIRQGSIPPLVKLEVTEEDRAEPGRDFFEPAGLSEQHADTVSVIARIWRGAAQRRRLVVSAEGSRDLNNKPLTFTWVVLRGDEKRIHIKRRNKAGSVAEITLAYHERRPIAPGSPLESTRVDIGVFAHNGVHYSAPAFLTFFTLDSEGRTYDDRGRIVEIGYGMGETALSISDPARLFEALGKDELPARVLGLTAEQRTELSRAAKRIAPLAGKLEEQRKARQEAAMARNKAFEAQRSAEQEVARLRKEKKGSKELQEAEKRLKQAQAAYRKAEATWMTTSEHFDRAEKAYTQALDDKQAGLKASPRPFALGRLREATGNPRLWNEHVTELQQRASESGNDARRRRVEAAQHKLIQLGIVAAEPGKPALTLRSPGSVFSKAMLEEFNAVVLCELVLPGLVNHAFRTNFVDARLTTPKTWRDVYHHDGDRLTGWTRYHAGAAPRVSEFTPEGWLVVKKDDRGRPIAARTVVYTQDPPGRPVWANTAPLREVPGEELITFAYDGNTRQITSRKKVLQRKED
jgi:hypothetical protein